MTKHVPRILAVFIILIIYGFTKHSKISEEEKEEIANAFKFSKSTLYSPEGLNAMEVREVHPQYEKISTWISSVGAAITITDMDGDQLYNDLIHVDPRFNKIFISPAPNTGDRFPSFELTVNELAYDYTMAPTGVLTNDFNGDGKMDILVFYVGRSPIIFYNEGNYTFSEVELVQNQMWNSTTGTIADFNGDGNPDIFIGNYFPDESILLDPHATDKDQIMQHSMSRGDNGGVNRIFLWSGIKDGIAIFQEDTNWIKGLPYPADWTLAVGAADINNDLLPDLYISNDFGPDKLLLNTSTNGQLSFKELKGQRKFTTIRSNVIGQDSFKGMGVDIADINGDGNLDIYVSNIADDYALHESHFVFIHTGEHELLEKGIAPYRNESESLGLSRSSWGWDSKITDFNNDGIKEAIQATGFVKGEINRWPQLQELATTNDELLKYVGSWPYLQPGDALSGNAHIPLFVKSKTGKYYDMSAAIGIDDNQISRGIAISDIDHDGKLDFVVANQWEDSKLYKNISNTNENSFLGLNLMFPIIGQELDDIAIDSSMEARPAIGAFVRVKLKNGKVLVGYVDGGNGHSGRNSHEVHFGLGKVDVNQLLEVELSWIKSNGQKTTSTLQLNSGWHRIILPF